MFMEDHPREDYFNECMIQLLARSYAQTFNDFGLARRLQVHARTHTLSMASGAFSPTAVTVGC